MITPIPFDPHRFQTAAQHYFARPGYSPRLIERVAEVTGLAADDRVMDLGCGPGLLAIAFAPLVAEVVAIDPEREMLKRAEEAAGDLGGRIRFVEASSNDLGPQFGTFRLVAIGRAFHWMDRVETLRRLDRIVAPGGALALFDNSHLATQANGWLRDYREILQRHSKAAGQPDWRGPDWVRHEAVLLDSAFCRLERFTVIERRTLDADSLVSRALSMSRTSPGMLGEAGVRAIEAEIRALAARVAADGVLAETIETNALVAWRP
jgi:SAM-dependent methyltransferase